MNYDLRDLLKTPHEPLTKEQYENFDKYMAMTNDDKSADTVDLMPAVLELTAEMNAKKSYW